MLRTSGQEPEAPAHAGDRQWGKDFLWKILICAGVTAFLSYLLYILGTTQLAADPQLSDQGLASYIGIIFATAVALAGSLVAIKLADRALESGDVQLDLSRLANEIAERQSTESTLAVEGTAQYQQFKSMLITIPAMLRRAHRDHLFDQGGDIAMLRHMVEIIGGAITNWLSSNVPATVVELAGIIKKQVPPHTPRKERLTVESQRYFEYAISSLQYDLAALRVALAMPDEQRSPAALRMQLFRLLHGTYQLVHEIDDLLSFAHTIHSEKLQKFSILQSKFIEHALPVAKLNRHLQLTDDFAHFAQEIRTTRLAHLAFVGPLDESAFGGEHSGGVLVALHDSGHAEALTAIEAALRTEYDPTPVQVVRLDDGGWVEKAKEVPSDKVPLFFVTESVAGRLQQLHHFLAQEIAEKWPRRILVIDQVEQPAATSLSGKHLSLSESIACWHFFAAVAAVLDHGEREARHGSEPDPRTIVLGAKPIVDKHAREGNWDRLVIGKRAALLRMIGRAAVSETPALADVDQHAFDVLDLCDRIVDTVRAPLDALADAGACLPSFDPDDPGYAAVAATVRLLAALPLLDRPLFHFARSNGYFHAGGDYIDLALPGTTVFGVAYLDSAFSLPASPLLTLLAERPAYQLF